MFERQPTRSRGDPVVPLRREGSGAAHLERAAGRPKSAARDQFLADYHCGTTMEPVDQSPCVSYDGCDSGYPVVWCLVDGEAHAIPSFAASGIANFFSQF
jgi:hypothetical protein